MHKVEPRFIGLEGFVKPDFGDWKDCEEINRKFTGGNDFFSNP